MRVKFEEVREAAEVETVIGRIREHENWISIKNPDFKMVIEKTEDGSYVVELTIAHRRIGHDHDDLIHVRVTGIPAETREPCVYTGRGSYRVMRTVKVKVMGDLVDVEKVVEGDWKKFYEREHEILK